MAEEEKIVHLTDYPDEGWIKVAFYMEPGMLDSIRLMGQKVSQAQGAVARSFILSGMDQFLDILKATEEEAKAAGYAHNHRTEDSSNGKA